MLVPTVVLAICGVVVLVGGVAELLDTVRARRAPALVPAAGSDAPPEGAADVGQWPTFAWLGTAAFTVLGVVVFTDRQPDSQDLALAVLLLGFAGERAYYLVRRRSTADGPAPGGEVLALVVGAVGLLVGFTL